MSAGTQAAGPPQAAERRRHAQPLPGNWFLRRRGYVLYVVREFTAVPIAIWMIWFLVEIARLHGGRSAYHPHFSGAFIAFSALCLIFALWHSVTFLSLSGLIMRIPIGDRSLPSQVVAAASFGALILAFAVIGGLLMWGGR